MGKTAVNSFLVIFIASFCLLPGALPAQNLQDKPNIILIITDDQGIGDLGYTGNPFVKTPHIDQLARKSMRFTNFHVNPVCAPTRAAIMTGKYAQTTGIYDTYNGGAIMATEEITLAEILKANGYETGIFGKWHLGDNYPFRPIDQGFTHSVVHRGGGIGQPGDYENFFAGDRSYFDPVLFHNEKKLRTTGYCSDVFTNEALAFIKSRRQPPFFIYLAFNAPHTPLQVPQQYYDLYRKISLEDYKKEFRDTDADVEKMTEKDLEDARKVYGMVTNIDDNIGRIIRTLQSENIADNTIVIFMSDNGPQQRRYKAGYRGLKGSVYEAGVRVPFFIYGPALGIPEGKETNVLSAHMDILPTIAQLANIKTGLPRDIEGHSLMPLIKDGMRSLHERTLFTEWGRGYPVPYQNMSVHKGDYKLVTQTHYQGTVDDFALYDIANDPSEKNNLIHQQRARAESMKDELDGWLDELNAHPNNRRVYNIKIGTSGENPVVLNRNDAKGPVGVWTQSEIYAWWDIEIAEDGIYHFSFRFLEDLKTPGDMVLKLYPYHFSLPVKDRDSNTLKMKDIRLRKGIYRLEPQFVFEGKQWLPFYVGVERKF